MQEGQDMIRIVIALFLFLVAFGCKDSSYSYFPNTEEKGPSPASDLEGCMARLPPGITLVDLGCKLEAKTSSIALQQICRHHECEVTWDKIRLKGHQQRVTTSPPPDD